jgi:hypothetical protein
MPKHDGELTLGGCGEHCLSRRDDHPEDLLALGVQASFRAGRRQDRQRCRVREGPREQDIPFRLALLRDVPDRGWSAFLQCDEKLSETIQASRLGPGIDLHDVADDRR